MSMMRFTKIEADVMGRIMRGFDPWEGRLGGSRRTSQAVARLRRKGAITESPEGALAVTEDGRAALLSPPVVLSGKQEALLRRCFVGAVLVDEGGLRKSANHLAAKNLIELRFAGPIAKLTPLGRAWLEAHS